MTPKEERAKLYIEKFCSKPFNTEIQNSKRFTLHKTEEIIEWWEAEIVKAEQAERNRMRLINRDETQKALEKGIEIGKNDILEKGTSGNVH